MKINIDRVVPKKYFSNRLKNLVDCELLILNEYIQDGDKILDIGSETGRIGFLITDALNKIPSELFLTEINDDYVKQLRLNIKPDDKSRYNVKVLKENMMSFSDNIEDNYFDCITSLGDVFNLHEHPNPSSVRSSVVFDAITRSIKKLKIGGRAIFSLNLEIIDGLDEENIKDKLFNIGLKILKMDKVNFPPNQAWLAKCRYIFCAERISQ